jgi:hypothetical protein
MYKSINKMKKIAITLAFSAFSILSFSQSIVISPDTQQGGIYSKRSDVLNPFLPLPAFILPDSGIGTRMMWIPERSAFRVGTAIGNEWNVANIGLNTFAIGIDLKVTGFAAGAIGYQNQATSLQSFAGGFNNIAGGNQSLAFGLANNTAGAVSVALGNANIIPNTGNHSVAIGQGNSVQLTNNYLIGKDNQGKNVLEFAFGYNNGVSAARSFSFGNDNNNAGQNSFNFGEGNTTKMERAMNIGFNNQSEGIRALALGYQNSPSGDFNLAIGGGNRGSGSQSIEIGTLNKSNGNVSLSGGFGIVNNVFGATMLGIYNDSLTSDLTGGTLSTTTFDVNDPLFIIGNGTANNNRSNALTMYKNGRLGIGTNTPTQLLDVNGSARFRSVSANNSGNVFLTVTANGTLQRTTPTVSDIRLKQEIEKINDPLGRLMKMNGKSYTFKDNPNQKRMGFIAQEVEKVFPEAVFETEEGFKAVRYDDIIPVLLEAIKSQQNQIETLIKQVGQLSAKATP